MPKFGPPCVQPFARIGLLLLAGAIGGAPTAAWAAASAATEEPWDRGWALYTDNDLFAVVRRDQQYTGGFALELAGRRAREWPLSLDPVIGVLDGWSRFDRLGRDGDAHRRHSMTLGLAAFTPADISDPEPIDDDHPYGSVLILANTRERLHRDRGVSHTSTFALALLGTNAAQQFQNFFHDLGDSERAAGWSNQISAGGEPTFVYSVHRQAVLWQGTTGPDRAFDVRSDQFAAIGAITQAGTSMKARWGRIRSPWWQWGVFGGDYLDFGTATAAASASLAGNAPEWFFWVGGAGRLRLYNVMLQGQFRDSAVTYSRSDLRLGQAEASVGAAADIFNTGFRASVELRLRTREIPDAAGKAPVWGRIAIARRF